MDFLSYPFIIAYPFIREVRVPKKYDCSKIFFPLVPIQDICKNPSKSNSNVIPLHHNLNHPIHDGTGAVCHIGRSSISNDSKCLLSKLNAGSFENKTGTISIKLQPILYLSDLLKRCTNQQKFI